MNLYEFVMMFFYVSLCTGILSIGCHYEKLAREERQQDQDAKTNARKLELVMTNLENPLDK